MKSSMLRFAWGLFSRSTRCRTSHAVEEYTSLCNKGEFTFDSTQIQLLKLLSKIEENILNHSPKASVSEMHAAPTAVESMPTTISSNQTQSPISSMSRPRGLYIFGNVGTGKTVVMDLFFSKSILPHKRRVHFHKFMLEIHARIRIEKQRMLSEFGRDVHINLLSERDAIAIVAGKVADEAQLLCFDEFQVLDICDAMILAKLFDVLWTRGTVLVATSNRPPIDLYKDGLNRHYFLPFIKMLEKNCIVRDINSDTDYRILNFTKAASAAYYCPISNENKMKLLSDFFAFSEWVRSERSIARCNELTDEVLSASKAHQVVVPVLMGRSVAVMVAAEDSRVCFVEFSYLCDGDRGAADYQAICRAFDAVFLCGVPQLSAVNHNQARRFILLVDEVYDSGVLLRWVGDTPPLEVFAQEVARYDAAAAAHNDASTMKQTDPALESRLQRGFDNKMFSLPVGMQSAAHVANQESRPIPVKEECLNVMEGELASIVELNFAFRRTSSRLCALSSDSYFQTWKNQLQLC